MDLNSLLCSILDMVSSFCNLHLRQVFGPDDGVLRKGTIMNI